ncbi:hypothetical protein PROFUN_16411, partial [Planoprotostelium fungivorum]
MSRADDVHSCIEKTIPQALADLNQSYSHIEQIAQYCKKIAASEVFQKTQAYIPQALSNAAYHVHTVGLHLTNFLQLQANEIDKLELQLQVLSDRMKAVHDHTGSSSFRTPEAVKGKPRSQPKATKIEAPAVERFARQPIDLAALDGHGIEVGNKKDLARNPSAPTLAPATIRGNNYDAPPPPSF